MVLNTCKMWSNGIKIVFFQKITKNCPAVESFAPRPPSLRRLGDPPPEPRLWYVWITVHFFTQPRLPTYIFLHFTFTFKLAPLNEFLVICQHQATAFDLPFFDIFATTKIPLPKFLISSMHVIRDLPPSCLPIKNPGYANNRYVIYTIKCYEIQERSYTRTFSA